MTQSDLEPCGLTSPRNRHERRAIEAIARKATFTIAEFCETFSVSKSYTYNLIRAGELDARKVGAKTIITGDSAYGWFDNLPVAELREEPVAA